MHRPSVYCTVLAVNLKVAGQSETSNVRHIARCILISAYMYDKFWFNNSRVCVSKVRLIKCTCTCVRLQGYCGLK